MHVVDRRPARATGQQGRDEQQLGIVKVIEIGVCLAGPSRECSPHTGSAPSGDIRQAHDPYAVADLVSVVNGDQGHVVTRPGQRPGLPVEDPVVQSAVDARQEADPHRTSRMSGLSQHRAAIETGCIGLALGYRVGCRRRAAAHRDRLTDAWDHRHFNARWPVAGAMFTYGVTYGATLRWIETPFRLPGPGR